MPLAERLAMRRRVHLVDLPGHGASAPAAGDTTLPAWEAAATELVGRFAPAVFVGYSLGARFALAAAWTGRARGLVLVSGTAGIDAPAARAERRAADAALAARITAIGVPAFVDDWLSLPLFAGLDAEAANRPERLRNTARGLAMSLAAHGQAEFPPLWSSLRSLRCPVLVVAGERDAPYVAAAVRLVEGIGEAAELLVVPDAGHSVPWEAPEVFAAALEGFLVRVDAADTGPPAGARRPGVAR